MMMSSYRFQPYLHHIWLRSFLVVGLTAIGWFSGVTLELSRDTPKLVFGSSIQAQPTPTPSNLAPVTTAEINNYALAVLKMEPLRQSAYQSIKQLIGPDEQIPDITCHNLASINALSLEVQEIAQNFCKKSSEIVKNYFPEGEAVRFNEITILIEENQNLREQIRTTLLLLQQ
ncbi:MAG: DUF4168 domain-containing protein [Symploca sp. SIO2B6]|nr:DUF4168 domain-containing protein [Symploca sp. SIO2B6]